MGSQFSPLPMKDSKVMFRQRLDRMPAHISYLLVFLVKFFMHFFRQFRSKIPLSFQRYTRHIELAT